VAQLAVDGIFGPRTEVAVRTFQQMNGLAVDGIVGPQTWQRLLTLTNP
jgi:N-acetylmuramoyl-L-alanine amidase